MVLVGGVFVVVGAADADASAERSVVLGLSPLSTCRVEPCLEGRRWSNDLVLLVLFLWSLGVSRESTSTWIPVH